MSWRREGGGLRYSFVDYAYRLISSGNSTKLSVFGLHVLFRAQCIASDYICMYVYNVYIHS